MCYCFMVIKLLVLKILLNDFLAVGTAARYDYGYHPSAEEYDNLLSDTRRYWTHTLLKAARHKLVPQPAQPPLNSLENRAFYEGRYFVPKFRYESNEAKKFNSHKYNPLKSSNKKPLQSVGSTLEFNFNSEELPSPLFTTALDNEPTAAFNSKYSLTTNPLTSYTTEISVKPLVQPLLFDLEEKPIEPAQSQESLPIYFSNPATGIVYAITELGKTPENLTTHNGSIPIFVTKDQYERDILQLKNIYEQKCQNLRLLATATTTPAPKIIKLKKPAAHVIPITSLEFTPGFTNAPKPLKKPAPVVVKAELIVQDKKPATPARPVRKRKNKTKTTAKPARKLKKQKPPGHKMVSTTRRPLVANQPEGPAIILGVRTSSARPHKSLENVATQLEKPSLQNVFSGAVANTATNEANLHQLHKRSVENPFDNEWQNLSKATLNYRKPTDPQFKFFHNENLVSELQDPTTDFHFSNKNFKTDFASNKPNFRNEKLYSTIRTFKNRNLLLELENQQPTVKNKNSTHQGDFHKKLESTNIKRGHFNKQLKSTKYLYATIPAFENGSRNNSTTKTAFKYFPLHRNKRSAPTLPTSNPTWPKFKKTSNKTLETGQTQEKPQKQSLGQVHPSSNATSAPISTQTAKPDATKPQRRPTKTTKRLKKRKRLAKIKSNQTNHSLKSPRAHKRILQKTKNPQKKPKQNQDAEYYIFDMEESDEEDDDDYDEDEDDDSQEEEYVEDEVGEGDENEGNILAYDDEPSPGATSEAGLSMEEVNGSNSDSRDKEQENNNHSEEIEVVLKPPLLEYDTDDKNIDFETKTSYVRKRVRRRPPHLQIDKDYDYDDGYEDEDSNSITSNIGGFFRMLFYPIQMVMGSVMDSFGGKDNSVEEEEESSPYTQYTSYHKTLKQQQQSGEDYDDEEDEYEGNESSSSSLSNWFSSWFSFNRRNKKISSTTVAPLKLKPTTAYSSWLPSWLNFGANDRISSVSGGNEDYDEYDKWFASWFGEMRPKARRRKTTTTTTSTTTQLPHVPILTIVDPLKNPQNWIGILAHHIINQTSTSTANPLKEIWNRVTTTTTENPDVPRKIVYDKYQIWRLKPQDESQVKALEEYKKSEDGIKLQWLKGPSLRGLTDVLVPPKMLVDFQASLTFELIDHEVLIFDVGKAIAYEKTKEDFFFTTTQKPKKHPAHKYPVPMPTMTWHKYYEYDDIIKYLETMRMRFPHLVELIHIGRSYEGRPLIVTKIESREAAAINSAHYTAHQLNKLRHKKRIGLANAVFIEAGTHGMEWIGPATATWIINELLRIMKKNSSDDQSFIRNTTWYILPVLNPDGYVYSHEFDRFWKKSRSRHISRPSGIINSAMTWLQKKRAREKVCFGVDLDRNWHYQWGRRGSSKAVCNEFYAGPTPFSEPETKALSEFLMDYRTQLKLFVSMQSYGQIISYPYKANTTYDSERLDELLDVAMVGTDNLRKKGSKSRYKIDSSNDLVENRSGCSDAFAAYEVGVPFSYTLQLADNGVHGYLLPSASIESTARDSFDIITGMLDYI